jgi:phenylacetate-CoA ligase
MSYPLMIYNYYKFINNSYMSREKLEEYKNKQLMAMINYSYNNVSYYHDLMKKMNLLPEDITKVDDLNKLPILHKQDIQQNSDIFISKEFNKKDLIVKSTSGSTGKPLLIYLSKRDDQIRKIKHLRANVSCGQRPFDRWTTITNVNQRTKVPGTLEFLSVFTPRPISIFESQQNQMDLLEKIQPNVIDAYPSCLYLLAKEIERRGTKKINPRLNFCGAESCSQTQMDYIEKIFQAPLYDQYATIEFERVAWQCPKKTGYHIDEDTTVVQFLDQDGSEVSSGESGEIICTSLINYAMPLIRYSMGDIGVLSDDKCSCGRTLAMMKVIEGRKGDYIVLPDGRTISPTSFQLLMRGPFQTKIEEWQVVQKENESIDIYVKKSNKNIEDKELEASMKTFMYGLIKIDPNSFSINILFVEEIKREKSGKMRPVISTISRGSSIA